MGPYPHEAPAAAITPANPAGTDGFGFVEYAHPNPGELHALFVRRWASPQRGQAPQRRLITLYRQGDVNYLVNEEPGSHAVNFAAARGPCARLRWQFRVVDAATGLSHGRWRGGAEPADPADGARWRWDVPCHQGHRRLAAVLPGHAMARRARRSLPEFAWIGRRQIPMPEGVGLYYLDHLTHNVGARPDGRMVRLLRAHLQLSAKFATSTSRGEYTGLFSRALTSPDGKIRIPINESADDRSQIEEYLHAIQGRGHPAHGVRLP